MAGTRWAPNEWRRMLNEVFANPLGGNAQAYNNNMQVWPPQKHPSTQPCPIRGAGLATATATSPNLRASQDSTTADAPLRWRDGDNLVCRGRHVAADGDAACIESLHVVSCGIAHYREAVRLGRALRDYGHETAGNGNSIGVLKDMCVCDNPQPTNHPPTRLRSRGGHIF